MIVNREREPNISLYYLGGIILNILKQVMSISLEELLSEIQKYFDEQVHIDFVYYALDWLFLLSVIRIEEGVVYYEDKKVNSTQNKAF